MNFFKSVDIDSDDELIAGKSRRKSFVTGELSIMGNNEQSSKKEITVSETDNLDEELSVIIIIVPNCSSYSTIEIIEIK